MTDLRKAAEMALEALRNAEIVKMEQLEAMYALQEALAQPEQYDQTALELCNVCGWKAVIPDEGCLVCARKNQGPVAWLNITDEGERYIQFANSIKDFSEGTKFYTAPPKREWVGLTKEDMPVGDNPMFDTDEFAFGAAWAQAKLKEKNNG